MAEQRSVRLTTALGDKLRFRRMAGEEALEPPVPLRARARQRRSGQSTSTDLLGTGMSVEIDLLGGGQRHFHGLVSRFAFIGSEATRRATARRCGPGCGFSAAPPTAGSSRRRSVPDIVKAIFDKHAGERCTSRIG